MIDDALVLARLDESQRQKFEMLKLLLGPEVLDALNNERRLVTDVWCNSDGQWWLEEKLPDGPSGGSPARARRKLGRTSRPEDVRQIINFAADLGGAVANRLNPRIEVELPWGQRFSGVVPPNAYRPALAIRVHRRQPVTLESYLEHGRIDEHGMYVLDWAIRARPPMNIVVCGVTGSGKTAFADAMCGHEVIRGERIVSIEETGELRLEHVEDKERFIVDRAQVVQAKGRAKGDEVVHQVRALVRAAMRFRPDRIIIGEARGGEVLEWLKATYTGHSGGILTMHADNPEDAMDRLEMMLAESVMDIRPYRPRLVRAVDRIVWMQRDAEVGWKVAGIYGPSGYDAAGGRYVVDTMTGVSIER
jgi:Flp pilus assembly CpaF family ATPase